MHWCIQMIMIVQWNENMRCCYKKYIICTKLKCWHYVKSNRCYNNNLKWFDVTIHYFGLQSQQPHSLILITVVGIENWQLFVTPPHIFAETILQTWRIGIKFFNVKGAVSKTEGVTPFMWVFIKVLVLKNAGFVFLYHIKILLNRDHTFGSNFYLDAMHALALQLWQLKLKTS